MSAPQPTIIRHHTPDAHRLDGGAFWTVLTVRAGQVVGELDRINFDIDGQLDVVYEARIHVQDVIGTGLAGVHVDDPQILRDLVTVAGVLAEEMTR